MSDFLLYRDFGYVESLAPNLPDAFRIYKGMNNYRNMSIPCGFGKVLSITWQGNHLHVRTDKGVTFVFRDFNDWTRM